MKTLRLYPTNINQRYMDEIVSVLDNGGLVIYPTDSLYAIGCDALDNRAIERLCMIKGLNPAKNRLSVVCSDISQASEYARIDNRAYGILRSHLPGCYTFLLPAASTLPKAFKGRRTVGVRIPDNAVARAIAEALGRPVMTTSIDVSGLDPDDIEQPDSIALRYDNLADLMVDGGLGECVPSTVIDLTDSSAPEVIRMGKGLWDEQ